MRVLVRRHHHNGRWEARIGYAYGKKYLYLGTFGMCLFLGLPLHFASTDRKKPHFSYKIAPYTIQDHCYRIVHSAILSVWINFHFAF